ncbi:EAL domain-containing protein [Paraburkholderia silviterrae]|uniref:EAL domain-containing protein n=1 Tax=Paraburkholderia silviterrae TaxID=2528715 RepID=A0A4R5M8Y8_9BURK|nr:EAL domain-containing protein [Paraburkholderia silviterrae]TDG22868.1 EAL domain-containing protein [Paraburkholderia silviterrae]
MRASALLLRCRRISNFYDSFRALAALSSEHDGIHNGETGMVSWLRRNTKRDNATDTQSIGPDIPVPARHALPGHWWVAYQPIVCARSGALTGAEAFARWKPQANALLPQANGAPIAPHAGPPPLEFEAAFEVGCAELARWQRRTPHCVALSIDIALDQMLGNDFSPMVERCIHRHAIRPQRVKFEMREPGERDITRTLIERMSGLRRMGIAIVLDDFGMEHSTLSSLIALPVSGLKFGSRFTRNLPHDTTSTGIMASVVSLARNLGISVAVDGVQTDSQLAWLRQFADLDVQGSLISEPVSGETLLARMLCSPGSEAITRNEAQHWAPSPNARTEKLSA